MDRKNAFWLVWCEYGGVPTYLHPTRQSAEKEAERLARLTRGRKFIVLQSVCAIESSDIQRTEYEDMDVDEAPF